MVLEKKNDGPAAATTLAVHRCRFVDYTPSAITALAFPPLSLPSVKGKKKSTQGKRPLRFGILAVGHANGNIDLCEWMGAEHEVQCPQAWVVTQTLSGPYPSKVDSLAFVIRNPGNLEEDSVPKISDLRLFSSGGGSELIEWDIQRSRIRRTINSQGGSIWSLAANPSSTLLALGCEDGTVRILSVEDDTLTHVRRLGKVKCRMLSIAWGPAVPKRQRKQKQKQKSTSDSDSDDDKEDDDDDDEWTDSWLVTGCSDSSLRKWDLKTGQLPERMGTDKIRGERTLVWTVGVLGDGTIISGDSMGLVKFWDSRTCTQLQSFQAHGADVLCMAISPEGKAVYTSGVDQKTVQFSLVKTSSSSDASTGPSAASTANTRWAQTASKRMHSHDVRALATWPPYVPISSSILKQRQHPNGSNSSSNNNNNNSYFPLDVAPLLVSGGLDMSLVLAPAALPSSTVVKVTNPLNTSTVATFEDAYHRRVAYTLEGRVQVARGARLVSCVREAGLSVWRIAKKHGAGREGGDGDEDRMDEDEPKQRKAGLEQASMGAEEEEEEPFAGGWEKVLEMDLSVSSNIVAHQISDDGAWLAVSDMYETKLFRLSTDANNQLKPKRVRDFSAILQPHIPPLPQLPNDNTRHYRGTGALALQFTPDSSKLIMATTAPSYILVVDLTGEKPRVLRRFDHHLLQDGVVRDRVIAGGKFKASAGAAKKHATHVNGVKKSNEDVEMKAATSASEHENSDDDDDENEDRNEDGNEDGTDSDVAPSQTPRLSTSASVTHLAVSPDGQWLASASLAPPSSSSSSPDSRHTPYHTSTKTHIFNLDSVAHHATLPSFPAPVQHLAFASPPSPSSTSTSSTSTSMSTFTSPSTSTSTSTTTTPPAVRLGPSTLLLTFPDNTVHVYDVEQRHFPAWGRELARVVQRSRMGGAHDAVLGAIFGSGSGTASSNSAGYILFWSATWLCKVSLDALGQPAGSSRAAGGLGAGAVSEGRKRRRGRDAVDGETGVTASTTTTTAAAAATSTAAQAPATPSTSKPTVPAASTALATPGLATPGGRKAGGGNEYDQHDKLDKHDKFDKHAVRMVTTYRPILAVELLGAGELVVVERPLVDVLATLPPAYFRHRYGRG